MYWRSTPGEGASSADASASDRHNPHAAWSTVEAEARLRRMAAMEVARVVAGDKPANMVNGVR